MRTRQEIEDEMREELMDQGPSVYSADQLTTVELLLDIRELLQEQRDERRAAKPCFTGTGSCICPQHK